jgi:hemin uptake protein HemP
MKSDLEEPTTHTVDPPAARPSGPTTRVVDSRTLLGIGRELRIRHKGAVYTLRQTRQDKLILTK